jgi:arsenate reductase (glutaredoxin)
MKLYGITTCDTVRKARRWLDQQGICYQYHDLRSDGLDSALLNGWLARLPADKLLNRRSSTWKQLDPQLRDNLQADAIPALLVAHPTLIKRPVLDTGDHLTTGFDDKAWLTLFKQ